MNRNARLALVLTVALGAAGAASFVVYRVVSAIPVREVEVASLQAVVAARADPGGHDRHQGSREAGALAAAKPGPGLVHQD